MKIAFNLIDLIDLIENILNTVAYKLPYYEAELEDGRKVPQVARLVIPEEMFRAIFANLRKEIKNGGIEMLKAEIDKQIEKKEIKKIRFLI